MNSPLLCVYGSFCGDAWFDLEDCKLLIEQLIFAKRWCFYHLVIYLKLKSLGGYLQIWLLSPAGPKVFIVYSLLNIIATKFVFSTLLLHRVAVFSSHFFLLSWAAWSFGFWSLCFNVFLISLYSQLPPLSHPAWRWFGLCVVDCFS